MTTEQIRARLEVIENILFSKAAYQGFNILAPGGHQAQLAHQQQFELLRRERADLLQQLPPTGEASGFHLVTNRTLGTTYVRASEDEPRADPDAEFDDDPYFRFMKENGENWL